MRVLRTFWLLILLTSACTGYDEESSQVLDTQLLKEQLVEIAEMTASGLPTEDMTDRYVSYFADSPTLLPAGQDALLGRDAIRDFYNSAFSGIEILSNEYYEVVVVVDEELAVRRYLGTAMFRVPKDSEPISVTNRYIDVLSKLDGNWKIVWHSWTPATWLRQDAT